MALTTFRNAAEVTVRGPFLEELGSKESALMYRELPMIIDHYMQRILDKPSKKRSRLEKDMKTNANEDDI